MIDIKEKKNQIISFLKSSGPSIPVRIAKTINMDPVFASAILSELLNSKDIKISHLRIGSSPLYFIEGQEEKLENEVENLKSAEKEAYLKLRKEKILIDEKEGPSTRVALRNLRDFAIPFKYQEKIMWRYSFVPKEEIEKMLNPREEKQDKKIDSIQKIAEKEHKKPKREETNKTEKKFEKKEEAPKPEFLIELKEFLKTKNIEFLEEIKTEKKEIVAKVNIKTSIGDIKFLLVAKNKQTLTKEEINSALQQAIYNNTPCLMIIRKEPTSAINKFLEENNLIKIKVMDK